MRDRDAVRRRSLKVDVIERVAADADEAKPGRRFEQISEGEVRLDHQQVVTFALKPRGQLDRIPEHARLEPTLVRDGHASPQAIE